MHSVSMHSGRMLSVTLPSVSLQSVRHPLPRVWTRVLIPSWIALLSVSSIALLSSAAPALEPSPTPTVQATPTPTASPDSAPTDAAAPAKPEAAPVEASKSPEEIERFRQLAAADRLYQAGDIAAAEKIYRQVKPPFSTPALPAPLSSSSTADLVPATTTADNRPLPFSDPEKLSPAGKVFWREAEAGIQSNTETRIFVPLQLLVEKSPEFVPGHLRLAEQLEAKEKLEEAANVLERATSLYPDQPDLLKAKIALLVKTERWLEASIASRQFALLYPTDPAAPEFLVLADENLKRYQKRLRSKLTGNLIGGIVTGALGVAITGNPFIALSSVQTTVLLLKGESAVGERFSNQAQRQLKLLDDKETLDYVTRVGQKLAKAAGRDEFTYEFFVVRDEKLNAFALPGGKVFVNAGAIVKTNSEAEFAGLLGHELSHAVLSHGFQLVTESNLTSNVFLFIPYVGGVLNNLVVLNYSRDMERQADLLGTRLLVATNYAADGMRNLMVALEKEDKPTLDFLSSHPVTRNRVSYLETLIQQSGYNRYAYEGVEPHAQIQARVKKLLQEQREKDEQEGDDRQQDDQPNNRPDDQPTDSDKNGNSL